MVSPTPLSSSFLFICLSLLLGKHLFFVLAQSSFVLRLLLNPCELPLVLGSSFC